MRVLVIYGNTDLMLRARPVFEAYDHHFVFIKDEDTDFTELPEYNYDIIFSLHCKKIFPGWLVKTTRCINIHPGYNPYNRGMFPHVWSIINGLPAGATIHEMDDKIDHGPILVRMQVPVTTSDTSESLYSRVLDTEISLLTLNLGDILSGRINPYKPEIEGNYNSMDDFKKLCEIDPKQTGTFMDFYNILRALTHRDHRNAKLNGKNLKLQIL